MLGDKRPAPAIGSATYQPCDLSDVIFFLVVRLSWNVFKYQVLGPREDCEGLSSKPLAERAPVHSGLCIRHQPASHWDNPAELPCVLYLLHIY